MEFILLTAAGTIIFMLVLIAWRDHGRGDVTWYGKYSSQGEACVELAAGGQNVRWRFGEHPCKYNRPPPALFIVVGNTTCEAVIAPGAGAGAGAAASGAVVAAAGLTTT